MTRFQALRVVRELAACSDGKISSLLSYTDEVEMSPGEVVAQGGQLCSAFVVVVQGTLCAGLCELRPGESFGWEAMWERSVNPATVVADSEARLLVMSHDQFRAVKGARPPRELRVREPA